MSAAVWQRPSPQAELGHVAEFALDFTDRISTEMAAAYAAELTRVARER